MSYKTEVIDNNMVMTWEGVPIQNLTKEELLEAFYRQHKIHETELRLRQLDSNMLKTFAKAAERLNPFYR